MFSSEIQYALNRLSVYTANESAWSYVRSFGLKLIRALPVADVSQVSSSVERWLVCASHGHHQESHVDNTQVGGSCAECFLGVMTIVDLLEEEAKVTKGSYATKCVTRAIHLCSSLVLSDSIRSSFHLNRRSQLEQLLQAASAV